MSVYYEYVTHRKPRVAVLGPHRKQYLHLLRELEPRFGERFEFVWVDHDQTRAFRGHFCLAFVQVRFVRHHTDRDAAEHSDRVVKVAGAGTSGLLAAITAELEGRT